MQLSRILVPIDFSPGSISALEYALELAGDVEASVTALHIVEPIPAILAYPTGSSASIVPGDVEAQAVEELAAFVAPAEERAGAKVELRVELGEAAETITRVGESGHYDLIVMGTHGRTGIARVLLGSVAQSVVRLCSRPVLTLHTTRLPTRTPLETRA